MRIAYVSETYPPEINGVALGVERVVRHLRQQHELLLIRPRQSFEARRDDAEEWRTAGAPIPMYRDLRFGLATAHAVRARLQRHGAQIVHVATPGPLGFMAARAAVAIGVPLTCDFRTNFHWYSRYYGIGALEGPVRAYLRLLHRHAAVNFVPTQATQRQLAAQGFERLEVIGRGVDTTLFDPARRSEAMRASWGAQPGQPVLLHVGRLAAEKNVGLAIDAWRALRGVCPQARLVLVGDGPQRRALQAACPEALFTGSLRGETLAAHYASADLMVFTSESETFGNVTLEGLASGLQVIAYDAAAAAECIRHGHSGWLVPAGDRSAFITTVQRAALAPRALRESIGRHAREQALQTTWPRVLEPFAQRLAQHALGAPRARTGDVAVA